MSYSLPPIIYGPEGMDLAELLYEETLAELAFAKHLWNGAL
jgi:hypothetical protein